MQTSCHTCFCVGPMKRLSWAFGIAINTLFGSALSIYRSVELWSELKETELDPVNIQCTDDIWLEDGIIKKVYIFATFSEICGINKWHLLMYSEVTLKCWYHKSHLAAFIMTLFFITGIMKKVLTHVSVRFWIVCNLEGKRISLGSDKATILIDLSWNSLSAVLNY